MIKVLVIQGAGMDMRGIENIDIFGPDTLDQINAQIENHADQLNLEVEIFQSNDEETVLQKVKSYGANENPKELDAIIINPGGFTVTKGELPSAMAAAGVPCYEIHASNPATRGINSVFLPICKGAICGFGYAGYKMALQAIKDLTL